MPHSVVSNQFTCVCCGLQSQTSTLESLATIRNPDKVLGHYKSGLQRLYGIVPYAMSASYPISDAQSYSLLRYITDHVTRRFLSLYGHVIRLNTGIIHARDTLDCVVARRTEIHPPWTQQIGAGTISDIVYRMGPCDIRGHSWRSTLFGLLMSKRCDDDLDAQAVQSIATECGITAM